MIFIATGSQKFQFNRLLEKVDNLIQNKVITEPVIAQIGSSTYVPKHFEYHKYISPSQLDNLLSTCDLLLTHGGTGIIISALKKGKKVIGIPRLKKYGEHVDDHQIQLLQEFEKEGLLEACLDIDQLPAIIKKVKASNYRTYISSHKNLLDSIKNFIDR